MVSCWQQSIRRSYSTQIHHISTNTFLALTNHLQKQEKKHSCPSPLLFHPMQPKKPQCLLQVASPEFVRKNLNYISKIHPYNLYILIHIIFYSECRRCEHIIHVTKYVYCINHAHTHLSSLQKSAVPKSQTRPDPSCLDHLEILQCVVPMETDGIGRYQLVETWKVRCLSASTNGFQHDWRLDINGLRNLISFQIVDVPYWMYCNLSFEKKRGINRKFWWCSFQNTVFALSVSNDKYL